MQIPKIYRIVDQRIKPKRKVIEKRPNKSLQARMPSNSKESKLGKQNQRIKHTQLIKNKSKSEKERRCQQASVVAQWLNKGQCSTNVKTIP